MTDWKPRLAPGQEMPSTLEGFYDLAVSPIYADSGIQKHLSYLRRIAADKDIVELGMGGGDQSTLAWLAGGCDGLTCYDVNEPPSLATINRLATEAGVMFAFIQGKTSDSVVTPSQILMVDTLHDADTVAVELERFAPVCSERIILHDVVAFGRAGQFAGPDRSNQGISLAIAEFLYRHTEWRVDRFVDYDNGLLTLIRS